MTFKRTILAPSLAVMITIMTACGPSPLQLKSTIAGFAPLVAYEITQGRISPEKAKLYTDDANLLADDFGVFATEWDGAKNGVGKAAAAAEFVANIAGISADFAKIPHLALAMVTLNTIVGVLQAYYGGTPTGRPTLAARTNMPTSAAELKKYVDEQAKKLKQQLAVR